MLFLGSESPRESSCFHLRAVWNQSPARAGVKTGNQSRRGLRLGSRLSCGSVHSSSVSKGARNKAGDLSVGFESHTQSFAQFSFELMPLVLGQLMEGRGADPALAVYPWPGSSGSLELLLPAQPGGLEAAKLPLSCFPTCAAALEVGIQARNSGCCTGRRTDGLRGGRKQDAPPASGGVPCSSSLVWGKDVRAVRAVRAVRD